MPQNARKWHTINVFLDIIRRQSNFYYKSFVFITCYAVRKRNPINFQKLGTSLKFSPSQSPPGSAIDDLPACRRNFYINSCSSSQGKNGTASDSLCRMFQKCPLTFRNCPTSMTYDNKAGSSQYNLVDACRQRQPFAIVVCFRNINFHLFILY